MTGEGLAFGLNKIEYRLENEDTSDNIGQRNINIYRDGKKQKCFIREYDVSGYKVTVCSEVQNNVDSIQWVCLQK